MDGDAGTSQPDAPDADPAQEADNVQRVDTERMDESRYRFGRTASSPDEGARFVMAKPPFLSAWICLAVAWLFLGSRIPFTIFLGIPFDLIALLLGAVCLSRGAMFTGVGVLILGTAGSLAVYIVGLVRLLWGIV